MQNSVRIRGPFRTLSQSAIILFKQDSNENLGNSNPKQWVFVNSEDFTKWEWERENTENHYSSSSTLQKHHMLPAAKTELYSKFLAFARKYLFIYLFLTSFLEYNCFTMVY